MGKPRMTRSDKWKRRDCVLQYRSWADLARHCIRQQVGKLPNAEQTTAIRFDAYHRPPSSLSKKKAAALIGTRKRTRPDADNILKCLDAMWTQDAALGDLSVTRRWDWEPRLEVTIEYETSIETAKAA